MFDPMAGCDRPPGLRCSILRSSRPVKRLFSKCSIPVDVRRWHRSKQRGTGGEGGSCVVKEGQGEDDGMLP